MTKRTSKRTSKRGSRRTSRRSSKRHSVPMFYVGVTAGAPVSEHDQLGEAIRKARSASNRSRRSYFIWKRFGRSGYKPYAVYMPRLGLMAIKKSGRRVRV